MLKHTDPHTIIAHLVNNWPRDVSSPALDAARAWLKDRTTTDVRTLASETLAALDALLRALEGGAALDGLLSTREALAKYVSREAHSADEALRLHFAPAGGSHSSATANTSPLPTTNLSKCATLSTPAAARCARPKPPGAAPKPANRKHQEPRTENREPRTENREPRTENREPRTENREPGSWFLVLGS